ncbi:unnamed protein product [Sphagnum tenellum]
MSCNSSNLLAGRRFFAHRIALLASSDAFRAMFDGGYREKEAKDIEIPNISWKVFELMNEDLTVENVANVYELAEAYHTLSLRHTCVLFILRQHEQMSNISGYPALTHRIVPEIRDYLHRILRPQPLISPEH